MKNLINIKGKAVAIMVVLSVIFSNGFAQDGAKLFKQNCGACHKVDKNSIGPMLKGAKAKWNDAGEGELLYEWVADPTGLYNSGKSKLAKEIWDFNPSSMTAMAHLSKKEIDAIFTYTDTEVVEAPAPAEESAEIAEAEEGISLTTTELMIISLIAIALIATIQLMNKAKKALSGEYQASANQKDSASISKVLTNAVDIEDEASILLDHDYDGITELDNELPPWWVWMFYATIVFGVIYVAVYHVMDSAPLQVEAYEIEMAEAEKEVEAYILSAGMAIDETNVELVSDEASLNNGKEIFTNNCVSCHGEKGEGTIGPNLSDDFWLYGGDIKGVFVTVKEGKLNKGMPSHTGILNPLEMQNVASYVLSLPFAEGKAPEGEKE